MSSQHDFHPVNIAGVNRKLPLVEVKPGLRIAILNILGDTELVQAAASALDQKLAQVSYDVLVTAEAKSIPLICALALIADKSYVVLRKEYKPYMGDVVSAETLSITTGNPQNLYLDQKDHDLIKHQRVIIVDDVISTGSTLQGMRLITSKAGGDVVAEAAILTEGERSQWEHIIALGHLPLFTESQ